MKRLCLLALALAALACPKPAAAPDAASAAAPAPAAARPAPKPGSPPDRSCQAAADCEAVGCECGCSGGGVALREDALNRADAERWYQERGCRKPTGCSRASCPPSRLDCLGGTCHIVYGEPGAGGAGP